MKNGEKRVFIRTVRYRLIVDMNVDVETEILTTAVTILQQSAVVQYEHIDYIIVSQLIFKTTENKKYQ